MPYHSKCYWLCNYLCQRSRVYNTKTKAFEYNNSKAFVFVPFLVGMTRFELATPRPPDVCATGLRYIPNFFLAKGLQMYKLFL